VLISRLEAEYKVGPCWNRPLRHGALAEGHRQGAGRFCRVQQKQSGQGPRWRLVFMARSAWDVSYQQERNPEIAFSATKER
jgi:peptide chain release factor 3